MLQAFFHDYELTKLVVPHVNVTNVSMLGTMALACLMFVRRSSVPFVPLDRDQTDQMRGIAILLVILGHFWVHVADKKPVLFFLGGAISYELFLLHGALMIKYDPVIYPGPIPVPIMFCVFLVLMALLAKAVDYTMEHAPHLSLRGSST